MDWNVLIFFFLENIISFRGFLLTLNLQWIFSFLLLFKKKIPCFAMLLWLYSCISGFDTYVCKII